MYWYNSRWYDPALGRWTQPDTLIPDPSNSLDWDRYSYVRNNPVRYTDSSGHCVDGITTLPCVAILTVFTVGYYVAYHSFVQADGPEAIEQGISDFADVVSQQANKAANELRKHAKLTGPKPLLPDEQHHVDKLTDVVDNFLKDHEDLHWEALTGEKIKGVDHFENEVPDMITGLKNSIDYLESIYDNKTSEAQEEIDRAIENARKALEELEKLQEMSDDLEK